jgi:hypothetical protein
MQISFWSAMPGVLYERRYYSRPAFTQNREAVGASAVSSNFALRFSQDGKPQATKQVELETRAGRASTGETMGAFDWGILHFRRGGARYDASRIDAEPVMPFVGEPRDASDS